MWFFFYGTLSDGDVLASVLGHGIGWLTFADAILPGYRRVKARGASYPVIIADAGASTAGILAGGLDPADARRLAAYEGDGYGCRRLAVRRADGRRVRASVFVPRGRAMASAEPWSLDDWQRTHKPDFLKRLTLQGNVQGAGAADRPASLINARGRPVRWQT